ncbi:hypothetical protein [Nocardia sp. XZ_19_385]|uniref:hypothetical protein n=1 Tax=Nocardia sp. XZ_19_385 TaxID=2769488 RepID=UPI00188DEC01|nr:hypothetical protein [Nocardia sp. XZ_19_385]
MGEPVGLAAWQELIDRFIEQRERYAPTGGGPFTFPNPGAEEAQLRAAEARLGDALDPQHRELLSVANGWDRYLGTSGLLGTDDLGAGPRWAGGLDEADRWFRQSRTGAELGVANEPAAFRMIGDHEPGNSGSSIYLYVGDEPAVATGTTVGLPEKLPYPDLYSYLRTQLTGLHAAVPGPALWSGPIAETVAALAAVPADVLVDTIADTLEPWWRRGTCAKALTGRMSPSRAARLFELLRANPSRSGPAGAILELLVATDGPHTDALLSWLRSKPQSKYGLLDPAILRARGQLGDLTAADEAIEMAAYKDARRREVGAQAVDSLIEAHGLRAVAGVGSARELMTTAATVDRRLLGVRLQQRSGGDLTAALADPEIRVARLAYEGLKDDPASASTLLRMVDERAPGHLWALATLAAQGHPITEQLTALGPPLIELPGLPPDARTAVLRMWPAGQPGARLEEITVTDGSGVIDVRGIGHSLDLPNGWSSHCLLRLNGRVTNLDTSAYEGSVGRLVAHTPNRPPRPEALAALRDLTVTGETITPLREALQPLLGLLTPGRYELRGPEPVWQAIPEAITRGWTTMARAIVTDVEPEEPQSWYPGDWTYLVPTEAWPPTDEVVVQQYRDLIRHGVRPAIIGLRTISRRQWSGFVLDGHHKLLAYLHEDIIPSMVWITRLDPPEMTAAEIRENFPEFAANHEQFRSLLRVLDEMESRPR